MILKCANGSMIDLDYNNGTTLLDRILRYLSKQDVLKWPVSRYAPIIGPEKEVYFYHSDHLGSANWITL